MPPTRKRPASFTENTVETDEPSQASKRRRASQASSRSIPTTPGSRKRSRYQNVFDDDDDDVVFGDNNTKKGQAQEDDSDVIDLASSDEVPESQSVPKEDKRIKLSKFQCAICMDSATCLVVTHCGMWFPIFTLLLIPSLTCFYRPYVLLRMLAVCS